MTNGPTTHPPRTGGDSSSSRGVRAGYAGNRTLPSSVPKAGASVVGFGAAFPPAYAQEELWTDFFAQHYGNDRVARQIWHACGVRQRHAVADPRFEDLRLAGTDARMRRFAAAGAPLAVEAVKRCLIDADLSAHDIGQLTIVSCTGYGSPGIEVDLMRELEFDPRLQRIHVRDMGCYAAIPALAATADAAAARGKVGLVVCVELTSLHVQPPTDDRAQVVAHALFSDAAVAAAVVPLGAGAPEVLPDSCTTTQDTATESAGVTGFEVVDVAAFTSVPHAALMTRAEADRFYRR